MSAALVVVLANAVTAGLLGLVAWLASRVVRRTSVVHALWTLALLKLVTPPVLPVPLLPALSPPTLAGAVNARRIEPTDARLMPRPGAGATDVDKERPRLPFAGGLLAGLGFSALAVLGLAAMRARRFALLMRKGRAAPAALASRVAALSGRLGLRRPPPVRVLDARIPPLLWPSHAGPLLVLPEGLMAELAEDELDALLVHELAHVRRRDHWLRLAEILATALFWWYPVAWWLRRSLRRFEERCCDEWVVRLLPAGATVHALGLLKTVAFTSAGATPLPATASAAVRARDLEDRLTALLTLHPPAPLGPKARLAFTALAALSLVVFPVSCRRESTGELSADLLVQQGAPGDPLVKFVGLPVKVLPEEAFRAQVDEARRRTTERTQPHVPEARRRQVETEAAVAAAWESVNRARAAWLALPESSPRRRSAEQGYVEAMRGKDEATRRAADAALGALDARAAAGADYAVEIAFEGLAGAVATTRTDADGRFVVRVPRVGRYVVVIPVPTRGAWSPLGTVAYCWETSLEGEPAKRLALRGETGVEGQAPFMIAHRPPP